MIDENNFVSEIVKGIEYGIAKVFKCGAIDLSILKNEIEKFFITLFNRLALSRSTKFEKMFHTVSF